MRKIFSIGILLFLVFISMSYADLFTSYKFLIKKCPICSRFVLSPPKIEIKDQFTRCWTDGKCYTILLPEAPWLAKCPHCFKLFWSDDAEEIGEIELAERAKKWPNAWEVYLPSEADYYAVLNAGLKDKEKEKYCRMRAWWFVNEDGRSGRNLKFSQDAIHNLEALFTLLRLDLENERILKAEIARELGRFEEAVSLLNYPFKKELQKTVALIRILAERQNIMVQEIKR